MFFLEQFGLKLATFPIDESVEIQPVVDPPRKQENPKISPLGFEIDNLPSTGSNAIVGEEVFIKVNDDVNHPNSAWGTITKDDDGDLTTDLEVNSEGLVKEAIYLELAGEVDLVPESVKSLDSDNDIVINLDAYMKLNAFKYLFKYVEDIHDPSGAWYKGKFHWNGVDRTEYSDGMHWTEVKLPFDSSFPKGIYFLNLS